MSVENGVDGCVCRERESVFPPGLWLRDGLCDCCVNVTVDVT